MRRVKHIEKYDDTNLKERLSCGDMEAAYLLAVEIIQNRNMRKMKEAVSLLKKAGMHEFGPAALELALFFSDDWHEMQSNKKALTWFIRAADLGEIVACNSVAVYYEEGVHVQKDLKKATFWYKRGAILGDPIAQSNLAMNYEKGIGVKKSYSMALKWHRCAMLQGETESSERYEYLRKRRSL